MGKSAPAVSWLVCSNVVSTPVEKSQFFVYVMSKFNCIAMYATKSLVSFVFSKFNRIALSVATSRIICCSVYCSVVTVTRSAGLNVGEAVKLLPCQRLSVWGKGMGPDLIQPTFRLGEELTCALFVNC